MFIVISFAWIFGRDCPSYLWPDITIDNINIDFGVGVIFGIRFAFGVRFCFVVSFGFRFGISCLGFITFKYWSLIYFPNFTNDQGNS